MIRLRRPADVRSKVPLKKYPFDMKGPRVFLSVYAENFLDRTDVFC